MANEITRDAQATYTDLERTMIQEARAQVIALPTCKIISLMGRPTLVTTESLHPKTSDAGSITDGTAMSNTAIDATSVTATTAAVGLTSDVTDQSALGSLLDVEESAANFSRALTNKIDTDVMALYNSFGTTVGTSGSDLTVAQFLTAIYTQEVNDEDKNLVFCGHPIQGSDLRNAIVQASGSFYGNSSEFTGGFLNSGSNPGFKGTLFNIPFFVSSNAESLNSNADRGGAVYSAGRALGFAWKWMPRVETLRAPKLPGTTVAVTAAYVAYERVDAGGTAVVTDHE